LFVICGLARRSLEEQLLAGLQKRVLHPDVIDYTLGRFEQELAKAVHNRTSEVDGRRRQMQTIERKIANLTRALSDGYSPAITTELAQLERQLADAVGRLSDSEPIAVERRMRDARKFVESRLADLRGLLNSEAAIVRCEIAKHVQKIILTPTGRTYIASGSWDLLGTAAWMVPGARIARRVHIALAFPWRPEEWPERQARPLSEGSQHSQKQRMAFTG
jgi:hypothetical protein